MNPRGFILGILFLLSVLCLPESKGLDLDPAVRGSWPGSRSITDSELAVAQYFVFHASGDFRVGVIDFTDPANPKERTAIPTEGPSRGVAVTGATTNLLLIADEVAGLILVDIADLQAPRKVSVVPL